MTPFNPDNKEELSFHEIFEQALKIETKKDATQYMADYVKWIQNKSWDKPLIKEPLDIARENFGYWAGYYSNDTRRKIESLFECEHPYFGSIEKNGPPTPKQAFEMGLAIGERMRNQNKES
jgi:hypothetical protein